MLVQYSYISIVNQVDISLQISSVLNATYKQSSESSTGNAFAGKVRRSENTRIKDAVQALALCHNVTPVYESLEESETSSITSETEADQHMQTGSQGVTYQASSPDEVALVQWTQHVGLALSRRDLNSMQLRAPDCRLYNYSILQVFPFTSETKRMGIIVKVRKN